MKEGIEDWLGGLLFFITLLFAMIVMIIAMVFSPFTGILNRIKRAIAMTGLDSEQRKLLTKLSGYRISFLHGIAREISRDEDYSQAQMEGSTGGYIVLLAQNKIDEQRKADIKKLLDACREKGISERRIRLVKP